MDLSKTFDAISCDLLLQSFEHMVSAMTKMFSKLIYSCLINRSRRIKINWKFSSWKQLNQRVPQGSVLRPRNFADDTNGLMDSLIKRLEHDSFLAIQWFENNNITLNQNKCHLLVSGHTK